MDWMSRMKNVDMVRKLLHGEVTRMYPYPFIPQKPAASLREELEFSVCTPEKTGIPSRVIEEYFKALDSEKESHPHSVMLLRKGRLIARGNWAPYAYSLPHAMFSLSKSVVSLAIGIAKAEGLLSEDDLLVSYFPYKPLPFRNSFMGKVTLRHLLTMTSGAIFSEAGSVAEKDWVKGFLLGDCAFEPGSRFSYNSMNTYMLSAVLRKATGVSLTEYLTPRLYEPLHMPPPYWETCPLGIEKGGWGLYLTPGDMAKLGQLMLQKGKWETTQGWQTLVPEDWISQAIKTQVPTGQDGIAQGYGYQIWSFESTGYQFSGMFGQRVIVLPKKEMVIAVTAGSQELFTDRIAEITAEYFGEKAPFYDTSPIAARPGAHHSLQKTLEKLQAFPEYGNAAKSERAEKRKNRRSAETETLFASKAYPRPSSQSFEQSVKYLEGKRYSLDPPNLEGASLLPMLLSCTTNNFPFSLSEVEFHFPPGAIQAVFFGPKGEKAEVLAGLDGVPRRFSLPLNGESFWVGASARFTSDEENRLVLKMSLSFLETPCSREIKCVFYRAHNQRNEERILLRFREMPDEGAINGMLPKAFSAEDEEDRRALGRKLEEVIETLFAPKQRGILKNTERENPPAE